MLNLLRNSINAIKKVSGLDSDASAFISAAGLTDATQKDAINTLVKDLKASGLWSKMKAVYPMVGGTATSMKFNLKDPRDLDAAFRLTWSGGWTYSATGATPNGTNAYATTYCNLNSINSGLAHISYYSRTDNNVGYELGSIDGWPTTQLVARIGGAFTTAFDGQAYDVYANTNGTGFYIGQKNSASQNSGYKNGTKVINKTGLTSYSSGKLIYISRYENIYGSKQNAFSTIGELLSDQDAQLLNQIVEKYQVALSRGVQAAQSFYYNSAYSNEANTYLYSTQITGATQVSAINTLINGLKANNLWSKMKAVYPFITDKSLQADMAAQMKFNLVNPQDSDAAFRLAFSGGWTYSTNGAQPNGTNGYADTKILGGTDLLTNNSGIGIYSGTNLTSSGGFGFGTNFHIYPRYTDNNTYYRPLNSSGGFSVNNGTSLGMFHEYSNGSNGNGFFNDLKKGTSTVNQTIDIANLFFGGQRPASTNYDNKQLRFAFASLFLTDAEAALFYQIVQQFQTDLSRQV